MLEHGTVDLVADVQERERERERASELIGRLTRSLVITLEMGR